MKLPQPVMRKRGLSVLFETPSGSRENVTHYTFCITTEGPSWFCTCEGYQYQGECKHIREAKNYIPAQLKQAMRGTWPNE